MRSPTTRATTWSMSPSATAATPAFRRAPPARSTIGGRCREQAYTLDEQFAWDTLPAQQDLGVAADAAIPQDIARITAEASSGQGGAAAPPWSAAQPYVNLHTLAQPALATVSGNFALTAANASSDIRHIVLDFGAMPFPVLEGQSIGIVPPGVDANGRPHVARQYSVASPRDGERPGYNNVALTVKRVTADHAGQVGERRRLELPVRPRQGRRRQRGRSLRHELPDAEPSRLEPAHDLHRHRLGADARDDRAPPAPDRAEGRRRADAVLRRAPPRSCRTSARC